MVMEFTLNCPDKSGLITPAVVFVGFSFEGIKPTGTIGKEKKMNSKVYHIKRGIECNVCSLPAYPLSRFNLPVFQFRLTERILTVYIGPSLTAGNTACLKPDAER